MGVGRWQDARLEPYGPIILDPAAAPLVAVKLNILTRKSRFRFCDRSFDIGQTGGIAVALAAALLGVKAIVVMAENATPSKVAANCWIKGLACGNGPPLAASAFAEAIGAPLHSGQTTHIWEVKIYDETEKLVCVSRCTLAVVPLDVNS